MKLVPQAAAACGVPVRIEASYLTNPLQVSAVTVRPEIPVRNENSCPKPDGPEKRAPPFTLVPLPARRTEDKN